MIVFKPFVEVPLEFMYKHSISKVMTYNLTGWIAGYPQLDWLLPNQDYMSPIAMANYDSVEFDASYANYISTVPQAFNQMMAIVIPAYNEPETLVQIIIQSSPYRDCITEALAKVIQQRYGYNCHVINTIEDMDCIRDDSTFSIPGLVLMNTDLERFAEDNADLSGVIADEFME